MREARTPWVAFCDDDDLWSAGKLAGQLVAVAASGCAWAYTGAVKFEQGPVIWQVMPPPTPEDVQTLLGERNLIPAGASNVIVDRVTLLDIGGFDEALKHLADWDLWLRLLEVGMPACAPGIGVAYRLHPQAMSLDPRGIVGELRVLEARWQHLRHGASFDPAPTHLWIAMSWMRTGHRFHAAMSYLRAARTRPRAGMRGLLRTLHPQPPKPAHVTDRRTRRGSGLKRVELVDLPSEMEQLLNRLAGEQSVDFDEPTWM